MSKVPERWVEDYEFTTHNENALVREVKEMEKNSRWISDVTSKLLRLESIDGPIYAGDMARKHDLEFDMVYETEQNGVKLIICYLHQAWCVRSTAMGTLHETAKLYGSAFGRMIPSSLAQTLNNGLAVARGKSLMLERYGKISAVHSGAEGGYCVMPISELLEITQGKLKARFGISDFKYAYNRHDYTYAIWELPDAQSDLMNIYQKALDNAVSYNHAINFMPAVRFTTSDTASSSACLLPMFKLPSGTYFRLSNGIQVEHKKTTKAGQKYGVALFEEKADGLFAMFNETAEIIKKMAETEIWHPVNCLIGICNELRIPRKYADAAREEVERFAVNSPCMSMHDIYLSLSECVGYAKNAGASKNVIFNLEEMIARVLTLNWSDYDIGGVVAWGAKAA